MTRILPVLVSSLAMLSCWGTGAVGQLRPASQLAEVRFLAGWRSDSESGTSHIGGIRINLADGWKTYWRAPGEFGLPPRLELSHTRNIDQVFMHFPQPSVYFENQIRTIGYTNEVVFPLEFVPQDADRPVTARASLHLGVCREVCVPVSTQFTIAIPARSGRPTEEIVNALRRNPVRIDAASDPARIECHIEATGPGNGYRISYEFDYPGEAGPTTAAMFEAADKLVWFSDAQLSPSGTGRLEATARMEYLGGGAFLFERSQLRITLISERDYIEFNGCYEAGQ